MPAIARTTPIERQIESVSSATPSYGVDMDLDDEEDELNNLNIPDVVIRRLPIYVRTLHSLIEHGQVSVSSEELATLIGVTAAQIRRDLSYFGKFGKQGRGYDVGYLSNTVERILKLDRTWNMVLCGMGKLGHAIANYRGFMRSSFEIAALFDSDENLVGEEVNGHPIRPMRDLVETMRREHIQVGIIATPRKNAQETADLLVAGGVQAILNYAPVILKVPDHVTVREIDPVSALQSMTYYIED